MLMPYSSTPSVSENRVYRTVPAANPFIRSRIVTDVVPRPQDHASATPDATVAKVLNA